MTAKDLRERIDTALAGLDGDTASVRALCFSLGRRLRDADQARAIMAQDRAVLTAKCAELADRVLVLEDQARAARERSTRQAAQLAASEGEVTRLKNHLPPL